VETGGEVAGETCVLQANGQAGDVEVHAQAPHGLAVR
jgi:hypothetical protein